MRSIRFFAALLAVSVVFASVAGAEPTEVGTTAAVNTDTRGTPPRMATRNLSIGTNVFFEERIETSKSGQTQLLFLDESALTIASNSDVVLDKFIYDPKTSKGELALSVGAGLFRFVGGRISKTARVRIKTPTATIGIRGGIVIIKVAPGTDATRAIFMFGKEMTVTSRTGVTRKVTRPGFAVDVASKDEEPSSPQKVSGDEMGGHLTDLEGRTGQTAGLTELLTIVQVDEGGCGKVALIGCPPGDPEDFFGPTGGNGTGNGPPFPPLPDCSSNDCKVPPTPTGTPPEAIELDNATVPEDLPPPASPGGVIGVLSVIDADGDPATFSIIDDPDGKFQIGGTAGDELQLAAALDFEAMTSHIVTVRATDKDGFVDKTFTITVTNVLETIFEPEPTFAGRFKTESPSTVGTGDGNPDFDIPFSGASVVGGFLTATTTGGLLSLPTSGPPIAAAPPGFTGFSFDGTGTSSPAPVGPLVSSEGFISDDGAFIFYQTKDSEPFRGLTFAGIPASAFPTSGITAYLLEPDFVLRSDVPLVRGDFSAPDDEAAAAIDWGNGIFGGALIAIDGQGESQESAASVFGGSVVNGTQATADLVGLMRGTTRAFPFEQPHLFDSAVELSRDGDGNAFFGAPDPDYFIFQSDGGATEEFAGSTLTYFPNVVAHVDPTVTFGTRTTHTLNGFSGGMFQRISSGGTLLGTSLFENATDNPSDIEILTDAATGTLTAAFDVQLTGADLDLNRIEASFGGAGVSAFFDDVDGIWALEDSAKPTEFESAPVTNALLYMVTDMLEGGGTGGFMPAGVDFCQCEFLQWGFWGGDLELASGDHIRIHLANWVAGEIPALLDLPTTGTATYSGHIIGTVHTGLNEAYYQAVGGYSQTYNFATGGSGLVDITNFDDRSFDNIAVTGAGAGFTGSGDDNSGGSSVRTISLNGSFFAGGGDPVAQVGGGFGITGPGYEASGIFAADKIP